MEIVTPVFGGSDNVNKCIVHSCADIWYFSFPFIFFILHIFDCVNLK